MKLKHPASPEFFALMREKRTPKPMEEKVMTKDELRIKVAELCGMAPFDIWSYAAPEKMVRCTVPDYPEDLNAICPAVLEHCQTPGERGNYSNALRKVMAETRPKNLAGSAVISDFDVAHASAEERARAFVMVKSK